MSARLTSSMLVSAMIRRVNGAGGMATVLHKGEPDVGAILLICMEKGIVQSVRERVLAMDGGYQWVAVGSAAANEVDDYLARRRARDPDLWLIELDIAQAERFAAETTGEG
jgi:hypothetical protein